MMILILSMLVGCSVRDVRPGQNGVHTVQLLGDEKQTMSRSGLAQAKRYCKKKKKEHIVLSEEITFVCEMSEEEYLEQKKVAEAAKIAGSVASTSDNAVVSGLGSAAAVGGMVADEALGDCYKLMLSFECK